MAKWMQQASNEMKKKGTTGLFSAAAKGAGMSTLSYANKVLNDPHASGLQKKRANFARNAIKISRSR